MSMSAFLLVNILSTVACTTISLYTAFNIYKIWTMLPETEKNLGHISPLVYVLLMSLTYFVANYGWITSGFDVLVGEDENTFWALWEACVFGGFGHFVKVYTTKILK